MTNQIPLEPLENLNVKKKAIHLSITAGVFLAILKLVFGVSTQSMAVLASAVDSLMDVLVSSVNLISLREASKPADSHHAYGHGKIESLAGLFQSLIISASGIYLVYESIARLVRGEVIAHIGVAVWVMSISILTTFFLVRRLRSVASATGSIILGTESLHFTTDFMTNFGVIVALLLVRITGFHFWDLLIAVIIAIYVLKQSLHILRTSVDELIDRALPEEVQGEIKDAVMRYDKRILGLHNLRTRKIGDKKFIDFHVEIDRSLSFQEAHDLTEDVIEALKAQFPGADVTAHFDPEGAR